MRTLNMDIDILKIRRRIHYWFRALHGFTNIIRHPDYTGNNPAIAAVYSPYRISLIVMSAITLIVLIFGIAVPVDSASIAKAHVVVISNRKTIQHLEGGIVRKILVKDGDKVTEGQSLMELSDVAPKANRSMLQNQLFAEQITRARLLALRDDKPEMSFPQEVEKAIQDDEEIAKMAKEQGVLFADQRQAYTDKIRTLNLKIKESNEEIGGLKAEVESATGQIKIIDEEINTLERLVKKGLTTKPRLLELRRDKQKLLGDRGQYVATIAKTQQSINEIEVQILNIKNDFVTQNADALKDNYSKISDLQEKLRAASDVMARTVITAPTEGIVNGLKYHTEGGVVTPGTPIMDIVPQNEELIIEAHINPLDIDVVTPGLEAKVVFSAYKSRSLPRLHGAVTQVSADSFTTERQDGQESSYYIARVKVDSSQLKELAPQIKLYPGMPVEVYVRTGSRSFMSYLFAPITDSIRKAFSEK